VLASWLLLLRPPQPLALVNSISSLFSIVSGAVACPRERGCHRPIWLTCRVDPLQSQALPLLLLLLLLLLTMMVMLMLTVVLMRLLLPAWW
jgi:hypothetical protein